jgi:hypothetical protein
MERAILMIVAIVFVVAAVGFFTLPGMRVSATGAPTGNVIRVDSQVDVCELCTGSSVCAAKGQIVYNYASACAATCDGAHILHDSICERIPHT